MKNKLYYLLFPVYAVVLAFILYINGVFSGGVSLNVNLLINLGFLVVIGIIFVISAVSFARLNRCTEELEEVTEQMQKEYKASGAKNLWMNYQDRKDLFKDECLKSAFSKFRLRMRNYKTGRGYTGSCELEEYINEDLLDKVGMNYFNSGISGMLTGLGILGTFLGLSMGLMSFNGNDIYTISDNVGPLLSGMKVAFHTSVYGIFFSLIFNVVYRSIMSDAYEKLDNFLNAFKQFAQPQVATGDENAAAMLVYQANMANSLKEMMDLLKGNAKAQTDGVERIVNQFVDRMQESMGVNFRKMGDSMIAVGREQQISAESSKSLVEAVAALVEGNRAAQEALATVMQRQEIFAEELREQRDVLEQSCREMNSELSNQLYTFEQMKRLGQ